MPSPDTSVHSVPCGFSALAICIWPCEDSVIRQAAPRTYAELSTRPELGSDASDGLGPTREMLFAGGSANSVQLRGVS